MINLPSAAKTRKNNNKEGAEEEEEALQASIHPLRPRRLGTYRRKQPVGIHLGSKPQSRNKEKCDAHLSANCCNLFTSSSTSSPLSRSFSFPRADGRRSSPAAPPGSFLIISPRCAVWDMRCSLGGGRRRRRRRIYRLHATSTLLCCKQPARITTTTLSLVPHRQAAAAASSAAAAAFFSKGASGMQLVSLFVC